MSAPSRSFRRSRRSVLLAVLFSALMIAAALLMFWIAAARLSTLFPGDPSGGLPPIEAKKPTPTISPEPPESTVPIETAPVSELPWNLTLVNWENPLPEGFAGPALTLLRNDQAIDARATAEGTERRVDPASGLPPRAARHGEPRGRSRHQSRNAPSKS